MEDHVIICRCEEITYGEIKQAIRDGATTLDGIKRVTRAGKGLCQGAYLPDADHTDIESGTRKGTGRQ